MYKCTGLNQPIHFPLFYYISCMLRIVFVEVQGSTSGFRMCILYIYTALFHCSQPCPNTMFHLIVWLTDLFHIQFLCTHPCVLSWSKCTLIHPSALSCSKFHLLKIQFGPDLVDLIEFPFRAGMIEMVCFIVVQWRLFVWMTRFSFKFWTISIYRTMGGWVVILN